MAIFTKDIYYFIIFWSVLPKNWCKFESNSPQRAHLKSSMKNEKYNMPCFVNAKGPIFGVKLPVLRNLGV